MLIICSFHILSERLRWQPFLWIISSSFMVGHMTLYLIRTPFSWVTFGLSTCTRMVSSCCDQWIFILKRSNRGCKQIHQGLSTLCFWGHFVLVDWVFTSCEILVQHQITYNYTVDSFKALYDYPPSFPLLYKIHIS